MAELRLKLVMDLDWDPTDRLRLFVGTEGAADLASSTPTGGAEVFDDSPWPGDATRGGLGADPLGAEPLGFTMIGYGVGEGELGYGSLGLNDVPRRVLEHRYTPNDKCACLPVGVLVSDQPGNPSTVIETLAQLRDAPVGARGLILAATASPLEARLAWTASPDV